MTTAKPFALEADEPERVAEATRRMKLKHVVITAVARDDLADGGAEHFRRTIEAVRKLNPGIVIEILVPDFNDSDAAIETALSANPHIFNHNLETVRRLTPKVRSRATYDRSLSVLQKAKKRSAAVPSRSSFATETNIGHPNGFAESGALRLGQPRSERMGRIYTKSGLMLGLGETEDELFTAMEDLRKADCDILTLGQYLQPTLKHLPVVEFIRPEKFSEYGERARQMGFVYVASGPMVRSSYHADEFSLRSVSL